MTRRVPVLTAMSLLLGMALSYDSYNTLGEADHATGNVSGDTWTWQSQTRMSAQTMRGRLTMKMLSAKTYTFRFETSSDGRTWATVLEGRTTKK